MGMTVYGTAYGDLVYQSKIGSFLTIYTNSGDDDIYLDFTGSYGGYNYVSAGAGYDFVKNYFEGGNTIRLDGGDDYYVGLGFSLSLNYDLVYGGTGNDTFFSAGYGNYFSGGIGTDTVSYAIQDFDNALAGRGISLSLAQGYAQSFGSTLRETFSSIENAAGTGAADDLRGSEFANVLWGNGGSDLLDGLTGNDRLYGGDGNDFLYGGMGADTLYGDAGSDKLWGGSEADKLYGGSGDDRLAGGFGADLLWGGSGADTFVFDKISESLSTGYDVIMDFSRTEGDHIDLRAIDANTLRSGDQAFSFIKSASFTGHAGELRYTGGMLYGDVNGDAKADFFVKIDKAPSLSAYDFFL